MRNASKSYPIPYPKPTSFTYRRLLKKIARPLNQYIERQYCVFESYCDDFCHLTPQFEEPLINQCLAWHNRYAGREALESFVYDVPLPVVIEPQYGWTFVEPFLLLNRALTFNYDIPLPSLKQYLRARIGRGRRIQHVDAVISLRTHSDTSYSHTVNDVLGKIALLNSLGYLKRYPVVISHVLSQWHPFQQAIHRMEIPSDRFLVQTDQYIAARRIVYAKTEGYTRTTFDRILSMLSVPEPPEQGTKRLFICRRESRTIKNLEEVASVCQKWQIELVDPAAMSYDEQIALFSQAEFIGGLHGAGFVNMMFRQGKPLALLEIFPKSLISPHNYWLASQYAYHYIAMMTKQIPENVARDHGEFTLEDYVACVNTEHEIETNTLDFKLQKMLGTPVL